MASGRPALARIPGSGAVQDVIELVAALERAGAAAVVVDDLAPAPPGTRRVESYTLLATLAVTTDRIGLVGSVHATGSHPYHVARKLATLDHLSGGRTGWLLHTGDPAETDRTVELVQVVRGLWDSFDDEAFVRDVESGRYYEPDHLHTLHHRGRHFTVRGPLSISRPPQGHPPLFVDAGRSPDSELAALADVTIGEVSASHVVVEVPHGTRADEVAALIPLVTVLPRGALRDTLSLPRPSAREAAA